MEQESQKREAEETEFQTPNMPTLCANNCGFFGSPATNNLCSKCYKDYFLSKSKASIETLAVLPPAEAKKVQEPAEAKKVEEPAEVKKVEEKPAGGDGEAKVGSFAEEGAPSGESPAKKPPNRCSFCNKKVGLMGFKCRCGEVFCSLHRYSDKHNCAFDYRGAGQDAIAKANPLVKPDKVEKI